MKHKLTVTVDEELIPVAKRYARSKGVSLSALIEEALREATSRQEPSFAARWRGRFRLEDRPGDHRYEYLVKKYDLR